MRAYPNRPILRGLLLGLALLIASPLPGQTPPSGTPASEPAAEPAPATAAPRVRYTVAPEFNGKEEWLNSKPLTLEQLRGKVVLLHIWAFGCINCQRNLHHYDRWYKEFDKEKLVIIGVHIPETPTEADPKNVAAEVEKLGIKYPVAIDQEGAMWKAYENRYWPSIYVIDKQGNARYRWEGELNWEGAKGDKIIKSKIKELIKAN